MKHAARRVHVATREGGRVKQWKERETGSLISANMIIFTKSFPQTTSYMTVCNNVPECLDLVSGVCVDP